MKIVYEVEGKKFSTLKDAEEYENKLKIEREKQAKLNEEKQARRKEVIEARDKFNELIESYCNDYHVSLLDFMFDGE